MPKSSRGGKAGATTTYTIRQPAFHPVTNPRPTPQAAPQPVQPVQPIQQNQPSPSTDAFKKMTVDERTDAIASVVNTPVPTFLADNALQKALYGLKLNDKPTVVADDVLDKMPGTTLYRNVNAYYDKANDINYTTASIVNQTLRGSVTRVSDTGGSVHGRGIYFGDSYRSSASYGNHRNDITKTAVMRGKLAPTAKVIYESNADSAVAREMRSGSKLGRLLTSVHYQDRTALYALAHGYDAIVDRSTGYHVIVNRGALVMSNVFKAQTGSW